ncbi:alpha/beta hydrolase [Piscinibacter terrae]|uniref:Alpha/beta fold hydrolase n=1 Tax=Piscinibacter terrae TaxID=2496871 RepID=A0A3N7HLW0_9BURK|nr:alpha/beta fold hydrolase [Albitalea terrae]RQP22573.1 alpha/beta fold hydrolase [Albitalea terrae]
MNSQTQRLTIAGPAGDIECAIDLPTGDVLGTAVVCHPHPVHGGTMDNKVAITLARAFMAVGFRAVRFNFRGVGGSQGAWDDGVGEVDDAMAVIAAHRKPGERFMLGGFSFGGYVAAQAFSRLPADARPERLVLAAPSTQKQKVPDVAPDTIVVHGESDDVVPLSATLDWARPQSLPIIVMPGTGHFFHGQITQLKNILVAQLHTPRAVN